MSLIFSTVACNATPARHICYVNYITPFPGNVSLGRLWLKQPVEADEDYQNWRESETMEELAQIEGSTDAIILEGLVIRERILGKENTALLEPLRIVAIHDFHNGGPLGRNGNYSTRARPERPLENQTWPRCQQLR